MAEVMEYGMFIDGAFVPGDSGEMMEVINPATREVVARVPRGNKHDVDKALASARQAFESGVWSDKKPEERAEILFNAALMVVANKERLSYLESLTSGGTIRRTSTVDVASVAASLAISAALIKELPKVEHAMCPPWIAPMHSYIKREPIGVCAGITPWNFPMILAAYKFAPALAMGNSIVMKPASITPVTTLELAKILHDAGVPAGVFNVVTGPGSSMGDYLAGHPEVDKIAFTGSTAVGRRIAEQAAKGIKRVTLELGGKSPLIVLEDADLDVACNMTLFAFLFHSGQVCESGTRLIVPRKLHDALVDKLIQKIKKLTIGNQMDMATDLGPIASEDQLNTIKEYVRIGLEEGAELAYGGRVLTGGIYDKGFFFEPTIFVNCRNSMRQVREEIFGPVQCVIPYDDLEEAIHIANDSPYGLGGGVCSRDVAKAQKVAAKMRTGTVWINTWHVLRPDVPFGGYKESGYGRENWYHALMAYSEVKHICQDLTPDADDKIMFSLIGLNK
ncbi:aldehyde dehydrogenase (NAD+) [Thermosyntropha lipolytica DSM 11003]|uniref:Aldehyde dehydrogenase (NAD+) n=1 Tax=Thermosyntropha lipolytica DSM 11003 TaxID=1123382 RepID=A0A1M5Q2I4_9FIRM|nr:aldehyde dehydrogenase family protein [Thermosyntropha lipolytica]SHH08140.1 aldehyde dehydrogenase (NAD+) [Thermosyntropha lipolytica DSM 11003]